MTPAIFSAIGIILFLFSETKTAREWGLSLVSEVLSVVTISIGFALLFTL
ncbi:hypothetical protein BSP38_212 [Bacillus phage BSP38]|uniref:Uncharacterized protein n=1 Tax=Bacillus phage BSP38 TaxID=2283013 RepID=A0A345MK72_BPBSP|nr:hypothetical protein HWB82_gp106 [Bacillus phage BSP38]AXH71254.1 hypothetical protein BSP38_212 [Bacillus phage BSP38]